jgi:hypothetical protein
MDSNLSEWLRNSPAASLDPNVLKAADRIAELEAALKPFSDKADHHLENSHWMDSCFTVDECRAARAALGEKE